MPVGLSAGPTEILVIADHADDYAPGHLEISGRGAGLVVGTSAHYGSPFLGEETTVTYGDKASGTNHILPTNGAARYTGGLSVGKFTKTATYQRMDRDSNRSVGAASARISRLEGMEGHALAGDGRLHKYFPVEEFELRP